MVCGKGSKMEEEKVGLSSDGGCLFQDASLLVLGEKPLLVLLVVRLTLFFAVAELVEFPLPGTFHLPGVGVGDSVPSADGVLVVGVVALPHLSDPVVTVAYVLQRSDCFFEGGGVGSC